MQSGQACTGLHPFYLFHTWKYGHLVKTTSLLINFVIGDDFCGHQMVEAFVEVEANVRQKHAM